jgi:hypothetical protein
MFVIKERWKVAIVCACLITGLPGISYTYSLVFFIIPIVLLLDSNEKNKPLNYIYLSLMTLIMVLKPTIDPENASWSVNIGTKIDSFAYLALTLIVCIDSMYALGCRLKQKYNISVKLSAVLAYGLIAAVCVAELFIPPYAYVPLLNGDRLTSVEQQSTGGLPVKIFTGEDEQADDTDEMKVYSAFMYYSEYAALPADQQNQENIVLVKDGVDIADGDSVHVEQIAEEIPLDQINIVYHDLNVVEGSATEDFFYTVDEGKFGQIYIHLAYAGRPVLVEYTLDSSTAFWGRVLWSEDGTFNNEDAVMTEVPLGEYRYKAVLENDPYNLLEIVPSYSPGSYELKDLKISSLHPVQDVGIAETSFNKITVSVDANKPGILATDIPYDAFDKAIVNGEEAQAFEINYGSTGLYVGSGQNDIEIYYISENGKTVYILIILAAAVFVIFACISLKRRWEKPKAPVD